MEIYNCCIVLFSYPGIYAPGIAQREHGRPKLPVWALAASNDYCQLPGHVFGGVE